MKLIWFAWRKNFATPRRIWGFQGALWPIGYCGSRGGGQYSGRSLKVGSWRFKAFSLIDGLGLTFWYRGDEVIWLWPWKRFNGMAWSDLTLGYSTFATLADIDRFWKDYETQRAQPASDQV